MTITDSNGCTKTDTVTVPGSGILSATAGPASTICNGQTASLSASGGGSYSWSTGATSASISVAPSSNASYSVVVFAGSCIDTAFVTVAVLPVPVAAVSGATICAGDVATITASGGTTYSWNNGNTNSSIIILPTASVTYSVIVSNGNCSDSASATVTVNPSPTVSVSGNVLLCMGDIATLTASGATTYLWSNGNTNSMINVSPSATTTYSVLASSGACTNTASVTVVVSPPPVALVSDVTICAGNIATLTAFGGTIYSWSTGATTSSITVSPASATTYSVVVSITTCSDSASASVIVNPVPMALAWNNIIITAGTSTTLSASGGGTYIWSNGFIDSTITVSPPVTTMYCVTVSNGNCTDTACVIVSVEPTDCSPFSSEDAFVLPSAFSPNSDGQNDTWKLLYAPALANCIAEFEVLVYSRWGEKVFEGTDINFSWDGKYKNKIEDTAVFGYYLTGILKDGTKIKKSGNVSLLR
jgi:gliding motility-associated-like protein